ncbi:ABC transporter permease [Pasteurella multocida]|uniref:FecCD family ABC transporter permease n=1 Tax=Pasteurella multocida TaxID=747 RepID=UPI0004D69948|nr:iron ABC transporter permease [Pasteurella multocida]KEZ10863.1 ABC transporter permease [Pasteurella multocida]KEZ11218.1 ABC transporter permease [Pasteurella multocida]KLT54565.1 ABC transporter permease [Pasteurella multocida subsp. multocida]KLT57380.1 ABC transporter permease [Pasteurella multocida subsp. multocida]KLT61008.1 ABC transporter permease [Pasteurella multocida subsp. multocida]
MKKLSVFLAILGTILLIWFSTGVGFGGWQPPNALEPIVFNIRIPRILNALLVGAALAAAGAGLQALFENPLADPSLIGTSGGAALGVICVLAFGSLGIGVPLAAFVGALVVCLVILFAHHVFGGGTLGLLIMGFILSAFCSAVVGLILFLSDDLVLRSATIWLAGSLSEAGFTPIYYPFAIMLIGLVWMAILGRQLDCLMLGEDTAFTMGISVSKLRLQTVIAAALLTGAAVSLSGIIGFLGMMIPNILTTVIGGHRRKLILLSTWVGAVFLLAVDSASRLITYPIDLPVGIVIALLGGPFFFWIFIQSTQRKV